MFFLVFFKLLVSSVNCVHCSGLGMKMIKV